MGLAGRAMGLTLDRVRSFDVVTADGRRRRVDDGDLFWALRGGGGSFGIVTAIRLRTRPVSTAAFFRISYRRPRRGARSAGTRSRPRAPDALTCDPHAHERRRDRLRPVPRQRERAAQPDPPARRHHPPSAARPTSPSSAAGPATRAGRSTFAASSLYVTKRLSANGRRAFIAAADTGAALILDAYGGAINRPDRDATAFPHRDARFSVQVLSYTDIADRPHAGQAARAG